MTPAARESLRRKFTFLLSGATGFALYYALSMLLVRIPGVGAGLAAFVAVLLSIPPTFLLQKHFTFRDRGAALPSLARYCVLQAFNAVAIGLLARLGRRVGLADEVNFIVSGSVVIVVSYLALSYLVFRPGKRP
ncbi:GtrA family protein [Luteimonas saliphila]|uniref:GtrA family protein n=1 Tax=Luteimonas saliphila TaxID=2804919 RepID=UPI00192E24E4|nr:GtrA family protein [Luteimonas saliphila]